MSELSSLANGTIRSDGSDLDGGFQFGMRVEDQERQTETLGVIDFSCHNKMINGNQFLEAVVQLDPASVTSEQILIAILSCVASQTTAEAQARSLFAEFGSLSSIMNASAERIGRIVKVSREVWLLFQLIRRSVAVTLKEPLIDRPIIGTARQVLDYLQFTIGTGSLESVRVLYLDCKNGLIKDECHSIGSVRGTSLYPRNIVNRAVELHACGIIIAHNHPSGDPAPSNEDFQRTMELAHVFSSLTIVLHDHLIIGRDRSFSFRKEGLLK